MVVESSSWNWPPFLARRRSVAGVECGFDHDGKRCFYGLKHDLSQCFCRAHFDSRDVPDLQNENSPDPGGELQVTDHVSLLRFHHGPLQGELYALWKATAIGMS